MVKMVFDDLFNVKCDAYIHQVNCRGVMGSGVARQIKQLYPATYRNYVSACSISGTKNLGKVLVTNEKDKLIFNAFGQDGYGGGVQHTDYKSVEKYLILAEKLCRELKVNRIACPYLIGCGLGGANKLDILDIINDVFTDSPVTLLLCNRL